MIGYAIAEGVSQYNDTPPTATLLTRVEVEPDDPAFQQPTKFIGPVYAPNQQEQL